MVTKILIMRLLWTIALTASLMGAGYAGAAETVYIDPLFGGNETGPVIAGKILSKNFNLDFALKLKESLKKNNIASALSRERDISVALEERTSKAKLEDAYLYVSLSVSHKNQSCLSVLSPAQKKTDHAQQYSETYENMDTFRKNAGKAIKRIARDAVVQDSSLLAGKILAKMNKDSVPICGPSSVKQGYDYEYILNNTHCPVVIIDLGISDLNSEASYIFNEHIRTEITHSISEGIKEYLHLIQNVEKK